MSQEFIVHIDGRSSDCLKQRIKIAFTLTPAQSEPHTFAHVPVAYAIMDFSGKADPARRFTWSPEMGFSAYSRNTNRVVAVDSNFCEVLAGHYVDLVPSASDSSKFRWSKTKPYKDTGSFSKSSLIATNRTKNPKAVALGCILRSQDGSKESAKFSPLAVYHVLGTGQGAVAQSNLMLQAYLISGKGGQPSSSADCIERRILLPEDLKRPIFDRPLNGSSLSKSSTWRLCEVKGKIQLKPSDRQFSFDPAETDFSESISATREELLTSQGSLDNRLSKLESTMRDLEIAPRNRPLSLNNPAEGLGLTLTKGAVAGPGGETASFQGFAVAVNSQLAAMRQSIQAMQEAQKTDYPDSSSPAVEAQIHEIDAGISRLDRTVFAMSEQLAALDERCSKMEAKDNQPASADAILKRVSANEVALERVLKEVFAVKQRIDGVSQAVDSASKRSRIRGWASDMVK